MKAVVNIQPDEVARALSLKRIASHKIERKLESSAFDQLEKTFVENQTLHTGDKAV